MATAKENPTLVINIEPDINAYKRSMNAAFREGEAIAINETKRREAKLATIDAVEKKKRETRNLESTRKTNADILRQDAITKKRLEDAAVLSLNKQRLQWQKYINDRALAEQKALDRSAKGHLSWSQRMTKGIEGIGGAIKGMAAAWAFAKVTQIFSDSLNFVSQLRNEAEALDLTVSQFFAIRTAAASANVPSERLLNTFAKIKMLTEGGATDIQQRALNNIGINPVGMAPLEFFDQLLQGTAAGTIALKDMGDLVDKRSALVFSLLATQVGSTQQAFDEFSAQLSDKDAQRIEAFTSQLELMFARWKVGIASVAAFQGFGGGWAAASAAKDSQQAALNARFENLMAGVRSGRAGTPAQAFGPEYNESVKVWLEQVNRDLDDQKKKAEQARQELEKLTRTRVLDPLTGRPIVRQAQQRDRSFDLPAISNALPTVSREAQETESSLTTSVSAVEMIQLRMTQLAQSGAWTVINSGASAFTDFLSLQAQLLQNQITAIDAISQRERERWQDRSDALRAAGLEQSALYRNELRSFEQAEKVRERQATKLKSRAFEQEKQGRTAQTVMNTATAIINAWTTPGAAWIAPVLTGIIAASGALQLATIQSQQNPYQFREGGWVNGPPSDTNRIAASGGEFVVERNAAARNAEALRFISAGGTMNGGGTNIHLNFNAPIYDTREWVRSELVPELRRLNVRGVRVL
jgi:hypothetical protein